MSKSIECSQKPEKGRFYMKKKFFELFKALFSRNLSLKIYQKSTNINKY